MRKIFYPGYRFFCCNDCEYMWDELSRNATATSGDMCPNCCNPEVIFPYGYQISFWHTYPAETA